MSGKDEARVLHRARRVLAALAAGGRLRPVPTEEGGVPRYELEVEGERAPRLVAEAPLIAEMERRDWLTRSGSGALVVSQAGRAFAARLAHPRDAFRAQHLALSPPDRRGSAPDAAAVVDNESPLAWLRRRRDRAGRPMISEAQFLAGERLRADFTRARMMPRVTADWSAAPLRRQRGAHRGDPAALLDSAIAARARLERALDAVGPDLGRLLVDVCCFLTGLEDAERARGWPRRSGKVVLGIALDRLAAHYGLGEEACGPLRAALRHWGTSDYKPR